MRRSSVRRPKAPAAFRVPRRGHLAFPQASPQIFVHEGARQALERRLKAAFSGPVVLSITDNRHSIVSHSTSSGVLRVRLHHMFLDAPLAVLDALVSYVTRGDRKASVRVGQFIDTNTDRLDRRMRRQSLVTKGKHHDLLGLYRKLNAHYFGGGLHVTVTWGRRAPGPAKRRTTIKLGTYSAAERMIRVHPALDRRWVPRYFVEFILYHEMLHHALPASRGPARRMLHPPEFRVREQEFRSFDRAVAWERRNIGRLLRG